MEWGKLRQFRLKRHWTLVQAASKIGVDPKTLDKWELGKSHPRGYNAEQLCKIYEMSPSLLLKRDDGMEIPLEAQRIQFVHTDLTMRLLALASGSHRYLDIQRKITQIIEEDMNHDTIGRREALYRLATFPLLMTTSNARTEDVINQCTAGAAACWQLSQSTEHTDLALAFDGASTYFSWLTALVKDSPRHSKTAAALATRCASLKALLGWHLQGPAQAIQYAKDAVTYGRISEDVSLHINALKYLGWAYFYDLKSVQGLQTMEQAVLIMKRNNASVPTSLKGNIYSSLAYAQARNGQKVTATLRLAEEALLHNEDFGGDPPVPTLMHNIGMALLAQGDYDQTFAMIGQIIDLETLSPKMPLPARSQIEAINALALASLKRQDKDLEMTMHLWQKGIQGAKALKSEQRFAESLKVYEIMEALWSDDLRVTSLRDLAVHW